MGGFESKPDAGKTEAERVKMYKKEIRKAVSSMEREIRKLEGQEATLKASILKAGKEQKTGELKTFVKDYLRTQRTIQKFYDMKGHLTGVQTTIQMTESTISLSSGLKNASKALREMNQRMNVPQLTHILSEFAKGVGEAEITQEMMGVSVPCFAFLFFLLLLPVCGRVGLSSPQHIVLRLLFRAPFF